MKAKICGITNLEDAQQAIDAGADALGFIFYKKSPRYISPEDASTLIKKLPCFVEKVGLFVEHTVDEINQTMKQCKLTLAQIHFEVDETFLDAITYPTLPVIRAKSAKDIATFPNRMKLVDAYCEAYGGSGKRLNLEWFEGVDCSRIIIAGGLTPLNVQELKEHHFYAVDVSSGVERSKGFKDHSKVSEFIKHAKSI